MVVLSWQVGVNNDIQPSTRGNRKSLVEIRELNLDDFTLNDMVDDLNEEEFEFNSIKS